MSPERNTRNSKAEMEALKTQIQEMLKKQGLPSAEKERSKKRRKDRPNRQKGGLGNPAGVRAASRRNPVPIDGRSLVVEKNIPCGMPACHGSGGKGMVAKAAELREMAADLTDPELKNGL